MNGLDEEEPPCKVLPQNHIQGPRASTSEIRIRQVLMLTRNDVLFRKMSNLAMMSARSVIPNHMSSSWVCGGKV